ncbi:hypothetical protein AAEZ42_12080 [Limosilactobacillus fermentum]
MPTSRLADLCQALRGDPAYEACLADSLVAARTQAAATGQQLKVMNEEGDLIDA